MLYPKKLLPWYRDVDSMSEGLVTSKDAARFLAISRTMLPREFEEALMAEIYLLR